MQALADDGHEWVTFMNNGKNRWLALRAIPHKSVWWFKIVRWERSHATQTCVPPQAMLKRDLWIPAPITMQTFKESGYELCRLTGSQYLIDWMISLLRRDRNASRRPHADINGFTRRYSWLLIWIGVKIWKTPECLSMFTPKGSQIHTHYGVIARYPLILNLPFVKIYSNKDFNLTLH